MTPESGGLVVLLGVYPSPNLHGFDLPASRQIPVVLLDICPIWGNPSSKWAASSGSDVQDSSGICTTSSSSLGLGVGKEGADAGAGAMGSFSATSNISRFRRLSSSMRGTRHWQSSCTTSYSTPGGVPDHTAQLGRATAWATVSFLFTSL